MPAGPPAVTVNGVACSLVGTDPATTALDFVRGQGLTGAKEGCAEGECGACAVLVVRPDGTDRSRWTAVNACLVPAAALDGQEVVTAEGLGAPGALHPVQRELAVRGGSQCGYCTPGFVCSMAAEYYREDRRGGAHPDHEHGPNGFDLHAIGGNLCRCTGYRPIRDAAFALDRPDPQDSLAERLDRPAPAVAPTRLVGPSGAFERAVDLAHLLRLLDEHPDAVLVAGSTDWGVDVNLRGARAPFLVGIDRVPELRVLSVGDAHRRGGGRRRRDGRDRRGAHPQRGRARAGWPRSPPRPAAPPVRLPAHPQRRHAGRKPRDGIADRGCRAGAPRARRRPRPHVDRRRPRGAAVGVLHGLPADGQATGRGHPLRADPVAAQRRSPPSTRPRSDASTTSRASRRRSPCRSTTASSCVPGSGSVVSPPRRCAPGRPRPRSRVAPGQPETVRAAADVLGREGTPIDDHRASAAYRSAMLRTALPRLHARTTTRPSPEVTA